MPKMKTHKGAKKRFRMTKNGKIMRNQANRSHLLRKKSPKRKRRLRKTEKVHRSNKESIKKLI